MNKRFMLKYLMFILLAFTAQVSVGEDSSYSVVNVWEPGKYSLHQDCFVSLITSVQKEEKAFEQSRITFNWNAEVSELQNGGVQQIELQATRITMRFESKGMFFSYWDSTNNSLNKPFEKEVFNRFLNAKFNLSFKNGEVVGVTADGDVWDGLSPGNQDEKVFLERFQSLPTLENFKLIFDPLSWVSTPNKVKVNSEWENEVLVPVANLGEQAMNWQCKLKSVKKSGRYLQGEVVASSDFNVEPSAQVKANMKAEMSVIFNVESGSPLELNTKNTVSALRVGNKESKEGEETLKIVAMQKNNLTVAKR